MGKIAFQLGIAFGAAVLTAWLLPAAVFNGASSEIVAFLSIVMAAVLPTMLLSATILKGDNLNVSEAKAYRQALNEQMSFWIGLLFWTLVAVAMLVIGKAADWKIPPVQTRFVKDPLNVSSIYSGSVFFALTIITLRFPQFVKGIRSLLNLHMDGVEREAQKREAAVLTQMRRDAENAPPMAGSVGKFIAWPDQKTG